VLPNGVPINGRIDRVDMLDNGKINLVDYKTGRPYIYKSEVENSLQGSMYALAAMYKLFPGKKTTFTIDALRFNPISVEYSPEFLGATMDYLENTYNEMQELFAFLDANPEIALKYRPNRFCGYCNLKDECPAIKEISKTVYGEELFPNIHDYARKALELEERERVIKKLRTTYESRIDSALLTEGVSYKDLGDCYIFYKDRAAGPKMQIVDKSGGHVNESTD
jgi:uncharacterized protein YeeX (DUF496 family)